MGLLIRRQAVNCSTDPLGVTLPEWNQLRHWTTVLGDHESFAILHSSQKLRQMRLCLDCTNYSHFTILQYLLGVRKNQTVFRLVYFWATVVSRGLALQGKAEMADSP